MDAGLKGQGLCISMSYNIAQANLDEVQDTEVGLLAVDDEDEIKRGVVAVDYLAFAQVLDAQL